MKTRLLFVTVVVLSLLVCVGAQAASPVLAGDRLNVGVGESGALIDDSFIAGIMYDPAGGGSFGPAPPASDYLKPGTPWEFYSIGLGGSYGYGSWLDAGGNHNIFGAATTDTSAGSLLSAQTVGAWDTLGIVQNLSFLKGDSVIKFDVTLTNNGSGDLSGLQYARGLDPDQDVYIDANFATVNTIGGGPTSVTGTGGAILDNRFITIQDRTGGAVPSIVASGFWPQPNPATLLGGPNAGDGDNQIALAWDLGLLAPGQSKTVSFAYLMGDLDHKPIEGGGSPNGSPELSTWMLLACSGLAGLVISRRRRS